MPKSTYETALIVGAGRGLSASLARLFAREELGVALAARNSEKLAPLCAETGAKPFACDATDEAQVTRMFAAVEATTGAPDVVVYNASAPPAGRWPNSFRPRLNEPSWSARLAVFSWPARRSPACCQRGAERSFLLGPRRASGIPAVRAICDGQIRAAQPRQSMARELAPQGIHIGDFVIDGAIRNPDRVEPPTDPTACSIPTRSPLPICMCCSSRVRPGRGKSSCGRGSSASEPARARIFQRRAARRSDLIRCVDTSA